MAISKDECKKRIDHDWASRKPNNITIKVSADMTNTTIKGIFENLRKQNPVSVTLDFKGSYANFQQVCATLQQIETLKQLHISSLQLINGCKTLACHWPVDYKRYAHGRHRAILLTNSQMDLLFAGFASLEKLKISNTDFSAADLTVFSKMRSLKSLDLRLCCLSNTSVVTLLNALCEHSNLIAKLDLRENFVLHERTETITDNAQQRVNALLENLYQVLNKNSCLRELLFRDANNESYSVLYFIGSSPTNHSLPHTTIAESSLLKLINQQLEYNKQIYDVQHIKSMHDEIIDLINLINTLNKAQEQGPENPRLVKELTTHNQEVSAKAQKLSDLCEQLRSRNCFAANYYTGRVLEETRQYRQALTLYMEIPPDHQHFDEARHAAMMLILDDAKLPLESIPNRELPTDVRAQRLAAAIQIGLEAAFANGEDSCAFTAKLMDQYVQGKGIRSRPVQHIISPDTIKTPISTIMQLLALLRQALPQHVQQVDALQAVKLADSAAAAAAPQLTWLAARKANSSHEARSTSPEDHAEVHEPETAEVHDSEEEATIKPQQRAA